MTTYYTSTGIKVTKVFIDGQIRKCKARVLEAQKEEHGYNFCVVCKRNDCKPIDYSHIKSVKWCGENKCIELAYSGSNVEPVGRRCHKIRDGLDVKLNWNK